MTGDGSDERAEMLAVPLCGERVVVRLRAAGIRRLGDLAGRDPEDVLHEVNAAAGHPVWQPPVALQALENLIAAADGRQPRSFWRGHGGRHS